MRFLFELIIFIVGTAALLVLFVGALVGIYFIAGLVWAVFMGIISLL